MKHLRLLLTFACVSIALCQSWGKDRVAPVMPQPETLVAGNTYYIYNVGAAKFVYNNSENPCVGLGNPTAVRIESYDSHYSLQFVGSSRYWRSNGTGNVESSNNLSNQTTFRVEKAENGYNIQRNYGYDAEQFVGLATADAAQLTAGNALNDLSTWLLLPADSLTNLYAARLHLFKALQEADMQNTEGYCLDYFENALDDETKTADELHTLASSLQKGWALTPTLTWQSDFPVFFGGDPNQNWVKEDGNDATILSPHNSTGMTLTASFETDRHTTLVYSPYINTGTGRVEVYVDGILIRSINSNTYRQGMRCCEELLPGKHFVMWKMTHSANNYNYIYMSNVRVMATPLIDITLNVAGTLGTVVLNQKDINHVKDVRRLKVTGPMNADDFGIIDMMTELCELDLSDADVTEIAEGQFSRSGQVVDYWWNGNNPRYWMKGYGKSNTAYLHKITLPKKLKKIGSYAFANSLIDEMQLPETVEQIGRNAFDRCCNLKTVQLSPAMTTIPAFAFFYCYSLNSVPLHEGITSIGEAAFHYCTQYKATLPTTLQTAGFKTFWVTATDTITLHQGMSLGQEAFNECRLKHLSVPENVSMGAACFANNRLETVELPTSFYSSAYDASVIQNNANLKWVKLKSPTMIAGDYKSYFLNGCGTPTLYVPTYLRSAYLLDQYWYNYPIETFPTADIDLWNINQPLELLGGDRFEGSPSVSISNNGSLTINGDTPMNLNDVKTYHNMNYPSSGVTGQVISNCPNIQINGSVRHCIFTTANRWYFISLPFDFNTKDVERENDAYYAMYCYDGASRAQSGLTGNWKPLPQDTVISAGTGFIYQTSKDEFTRFYATEESKQNVMSSSEFVHLLQQHPAESDADRGWNLVGNPYQCFYNLHKLNFMTPITVWIGNNYKAYSIVDDDYAIKPNEAFFVQCISEEFNTMKFPVEGRQLDATIKDQTGARQDVASATNRRLMDITLSGSDERSDQTRVVLNPQASLSYELTCDASKFMTTDAEMPQLYTLDADGTRYAINERPEDEGRIALGMLIPAAGHYSLDLTRHNSQQPVMLLDRETGIVTDLQQGSYSFQAEEGTANDRFVLMGTGVTSIDTLDNEQQVTSNKVFDLQGRRVKEAGQKGIYIVRQNGQNKKVLVK